MEETTPQMNPHHTLIISGLEPWNLWRIEDELILELEDSLRELEREVRVEFGELWENGSLVG